MDDSKKVQLHIRIPIWLKEFLAKKAEEMDMTMTEFILSDLYQLWEEEKQQEFAKDLATLGEKDE